MWLYELTLVIALHVKEENQYDDTIKFKINM
jgi:hypothetical protein